MAALRQEQQRWVEAEHALLEAQDELLVTGNRIERSVTRLQRAMLLLEQGKRADAQKTFEEAAADSGGQLPWLERQADALRAVTLAQDGRHAEARVLLDQMRSHPLDPREAALVGPASCLLSLLEDRSSPLARARTESMLAATPQGNAELRLLLRLLRKELDLTAAL
jgi:hypothetical protein